jgi:hypothetical protein
MSIDDLMSSAWAVGGLALFALALRRARLSSGDTRPLVVAVFSAVGASGIGAVVAVPMGYAPHLVDLLLMAAFVSAQWVSSDLWDGGTPDTYRRRDGPPQDGSPPKTHGTWRRISDWMGLS